MDVILLERVQNLGNLGDKVKVKGGFARNFLLPYGKAVSATKANLEKFEARRAELEQLAAEKLDHAQKRADALSGLTVVIKARAGEQDKLYGSIGAREIVEVIAAQNMELSVNEVLLPNGPMHSLGEFDVGVQLHSDVKVDIKITIEAED